VRLVDAPQVLRSHHARIGRAWIVVLRHAATVREQEPERYSPIRVSLARGMGGLASPTMHAR